mgnify:CR=1 FL=1
MPFIDGLIVGDLYDRFDNQICRQALQIAITILVFIDNRRKFTIDQYNIADVEVLSVFVKEKHHGFRYGPGEL